MKCNRSKVKWRYTNGVYECANLGNHELGYNIYCWCFITSRQCALMTWCRTNNIIKSNIEHKVLKVVDSLNLVVFWRKSIQSYKYNYCPLMVCDTSIDLKFFYLGNVLSHTNINNSFSKQEIKKKNPNIFRTKCEFQSNKKCSF